MFVILWEFEVKPGNRVGFEKAYGSAGTWVQLFRRDFRFGGTQLVHDPSRDEHYFTLDFWDSETAYRDFLTTNRQAYEELDSSLRALTLQERYVVSFELDPKAFAGP
jgi:heme-degrading monooxygenase HmoA